jgi:mono/diheme cytochrome c family protein
MARGVLNFFLLLAFVGSLGLHIALTRDLSRPNWEFMPEMAHSPAYDSYAPNPNFADGKTLQLPQPGTIPRGRLLSREDRWKVMPLHYGPSFEDAVRAGEKLHNPFSGDDLRARERGAFLYTNYCQMCHGPEGKGDGLMMQRGMPPSASLTGENAVQMKDGQLFHVLTYGQRNMSAHAAQLTREDRWKVILHVRWLQQKAALVLFSASTAGLLGSPAGQGPLLAASAFIPGRTPKLAGEKQP